VEDRERDVIGDFTGVHQQPSSAPGGTITVFIVENSSLAREALLAALGGRPADVRVICSPDGSNVLAQPGPSGIPLEEVHEQDGEGKPDTAGVPEDVRMTPREREVVNLIGAGLSNKEIAHRLNVASYTVKSHVRNVMVKLALHTRLQIAAHAHHERAT
jgi:DNA-binding CsgD family transcriptional regulator